MSYHSVEKLRKYNHGAMAKLRIVVKMTHMKDHPKEALTDYEADRVLESLTELTLEKLYRLAVNNNVTQL